MEIDDCCWVQLYSESFKFNNGKHRYIKSHAKQMHTHRWGGFGFTYFLFQIVHTKMRLLFYLILKKIRSKLRFWLEKWYFNCYLIWHTYTFVILYIRRTQNSHCNFSSSLFISLSEFAFEGLGDLEEYFFPLHMKIRICK